MTFDTFESLKVSDKLRRCGMKRSYPVVRIGKNSAGRRVVYVCINPFAVKMRGETVAECGIFSAMNLSHSCHYLNWERVS